MKRALCLAVAALYLSACTTLGPGYRPSVADPGMNTGEHVMITLRDTTTHRIEVTKVMPDAVCAEKCFAFADIEQLQREEVDVWRTTGIVVLVGLLIAVGYGLSHVAFVPGGWS